MEKLFKKGDKVIVTNAYCNNSENSEGRGIYDVPKWNVTIFTIEGTVKLVDSFDKNTYCSYALSLNGKIVGYVYNRGLELAPKVLHVTHMWSERLGRWSNQPGKIALCNAKVSLVVDGIYSVYWSDGVYALYKGEIK